MVGKIRSAVRSASTARVDPVGDGYRLVWLASFQREPHLCGDRIHRIKHKSVDSRSMGFSNGAQRVQTETSS